MSIRAGSRIAGTDFEYFAEGAYGTVFLDSTAKRIRKLYRCEGKPEQHCRDVFESEWRALTVATGDNTLKKFVIAPTVRVTSYEVLDTSGKNITGDFLDNAGFEGALVEGTFYKIGIVDAPNKSALISAFRAVGIQHIIDASVTLDAEGNIEKIIDIAMREIELMW